jgi:hypothetical protein
VARLSHSLVARQELSLVSPGLSTPLQPRRRVLQRRGLQRREPGMRQQQFIISLKADEPFVLEMRLWRTFVHYISQCLCSPHSLQRPVVCYLVLGWQFMRASTNLCNVILTHSLAVSTCQYSFQRRNAMHLSLFDSSLSACGVTTSGMLPPFP